MNLWHKLSLRTKFIVGMLLVLIIGVAASGTLLWRLLEQRAELEVTNRGLVLIETMNAVRRYTSQHVNPLLAPDLQTQPEFISESVPAFSARTVFENFRQDEQYANFIYKEATENPTNPDDSADPFEMDIVNQFRAETELDEVSGYRTLNGELMFYSARPLKVSADTCLACHSSPDTAPQSLINTYGTDGGFGWHLGDVVTAQMIYVPANEVFGQARQAFLLVMAVFTGIYAISTLVVATILQRNVARPLEGLASLAHKIGDGTVRDEDIDDPLLCNTMERRDEIGQLAQVFNQMAHNVVKREEKLKQEVKELRIEIDEVRRKQQVDEITGTEYFQDLQKRAKELRRGTLGSEGLTPGTAEG